MSGIVNHLESRLGPMGGGWSVNLGDASGKLTVCSFYGGNISGVTSFSTVGLSNFPLRDLKDPEDDRDYHIEIIGCQYAPQGDYGPFPGSLEGVASQLISSGDLLRRGDIVDLPGPMAPGSEMVALYAAMPVYFDPDFSSVHLEDGRGVAIVWMIPIGAAEVEFVRTYGWEEFEARLTMQDPDLLDLGRPQIL
ncbi:suppressor of fused domain protein [Kitasatospora albolonga]|uniref:suppressor of fused domain protein n=1 Tax=Kitasatospora albolonga TaxID=68173 RepID=UPI0031EB01C7